MRISTSVSYDQGVATVQRQQYELFRLQQQIASGRRILTPSDDPVNAARAMETNQSMSVNRQYVANISTARSQLQIEESVLNGIMNIVQDVRQLAVASGNPTIGPDNYISYSEEIRNKYNELLSLANQTDGNGQYLFSGFKGSTQPFTQTSGAGVYAGDQGQRTLQISSDRFLQTSNDGQSVFNPGVAGEDVFQIIDDLRVALATGAPTTTDLDNALNGLDVVRTNISTVTSGVGARLKELDSVENYTESSLLAYDEQLSNLQDLDYAKAISDLTKQQFNLEAAQKSFLKVTGLSLFNYI